MINELRALITTRLGELKTEYGIKEIGYRVASDQKMYPHVIWYIDPISPDDMGRYDFTLDFEVWGKSESVVFNIMEAIEHYLRFRNDPTEKILPTFYHVSSGTVDDPDKTLVHGVVRMQCQVYEAGVTDSSILEPVATTS